MLIELFWDFYISRFVQRTVIAYYQVTLHLNMIMPDLQQYPGNLNLIKDVEDTVVFLTPKMFISVNFYIACYKQEMRKLLSRKS